MLRHMQAAAQEAVKTSKQAGARKINTGFTVPTLLEQDRGSRLRAEHALRGTWDAVLNERQDILQPLMQVGVCISPVHCVKILRSRTPVAQFQHQKGADRQVYQIL